MEDSRDPGGVAGGVEGSSPTSPLYYDSSHHRAFRCLVVISNSKGNNGYGH